MRLPGLSTFAVTDLIYLANIYMHVCASAVQFICWSVCFYLSIEVLEEDIVGNRSYCLCLGLWAFNVP